MMIKDTLHQFIDEHWDEFMDTHHLKDIHAEKLAPARNELISDQTARPTADTSPAMPTDVSIPVVEQVPVDELDPLEEVIKDESLLDKRIVRTPLSGDKVYLLDEKEMSKKWLRNPDAVKEAGFVLGTETKITDEEMAKYKLSL